MASNQEKQIERLNKLIRICRDGFEGYQNAVDDVQDAGLKNQFENMAHHRRHFADELSTLIVDMDGEVKSSGADTLSALHRTWMDIRKALSKNDRVAVIRECVNGEKVAANAYDSALAEVSFTKEQAQALLEQVTEIKENIRQLEEEVVQYA